METGDTYKNKVKIEEETNLINKYNYFLKQTLQKFNVLFLCHSKGEYIKMMEEKGRELERYEERNVKKNKGEFIKRNVKKGTKNTANYGVKKTNKLQEEEEFDYDDNYKIDSEIFNKFLKEMKKKKEDFLTKK
jgi:hypothetical protein